MLLIPKKVTEFGDLAQKIYLGGEAGDKPRVGAGAAVGGAVASVRALRAHAIRILSSDPDRRSLSDVALVAGLLKQRNGFKRHMERCDADQVLGLAKTFRIVRLEPLRQVCN